MSPLTLCTRKTFAGSCEVFKQIMNRKGNKGKIVLSKSFLMKELVRHEPNIQATKKTCVNSNNTKVYDFMKLLTKYPLIDPADIALINTKLLRQETIFEQEAKSDKDGGPRKFLSVEERLCFIIIKATDDKARDVDLSHMDAMDRTSLEYQNSEKFSVRGLMMTSWCIQQRN